jgi:hypothetical protein
MRSRIRMFLASALAMATVFAFGAQALAAGDPLPSWKDGPVKQEILDFVHATTDESSPTFVPPAERIATFDNDGTLRPSQHPMYTQLAFALDRIKALAPQHPEWKTKQPFEAVLDNDIEALAAAGERGLVELVMASHAGISKAELEAIVKEWFAKARHPRFKRRYTELAYQPMLALLEFLRTNGFKTYMVSGGGVEFMRPMTEKVYGIPPERWPVLCSRPIWEMSGRCATEQQLAGLKHQ